jgi:hypothetical protein
LHRKVGDGEAAFDDGAHIKGRRDVDVGRARRAGGQQPGSQDQNGYSHEAPS